MTTQSEFKGVSRKLNACVLTIAAKLYPKGYDVGSNAPSTLNDLLAHVLVTGRMLVSNENCENTIFGDKEVNCAFRAWHDFHHISGGYEFTPMGEIQVALAQVKDIITVYGRGPQTEEFIKYIMADVVGQARYVELHGVFPDDQKAFVLAYLEDPKAAVCSTKWIGA